MPPYSAVQLPAGFQPHLFGIKPRSGTPFIADPKFVFPVPSSTAKPPVSIQGSGMINSVAGTAATTTVNTFSGTIPSHVPASIPSNANVPSSQSYVAPASIGQGVPKPPPGGPVRVTGSNEQSPVQVV